MVLEKQASKLPLVEYLLVQAFFFLKDCINIQHSVCSVFHRKGWWTEQIHGCFMIRTERKTVVQGDDWRVSQESYQITPKIRGCFISICQRTFVPTNIFGLYIFNVLYYMIILLHHAAFHETKLSLQIFLFIWLWNCLVRIQVVCIV